LRGCDSLSHFKLKLHEGKSMSDQDQGDSGQVPMMQKLLDNPFLLLFIGVASPAVLYLGWGIMEIVMIPAR
jgi:hypothetical protein